MIDWEKAGRKIIEQDNLSAEQKAVLQAYLQPVVLYNRARQKPEVLNLDAEWLRQAQRLTGLFASPLGKSRDEYIDSLPKFSTQPESYRGRFDIPLLVQVPTSKLTLARMCEITGIVNYLTDPKEMKDWEKDPGKFRTPTRPYATWIHDGTRNLNRKPVVVRQDLAADERAGTTYDGIGLYIQKPDSLKDHCFNLPGSQYGSGDVPDLYFWDGQVKLGYRWAGSANPRYGSVVAGKEIVTG